MAGRGRPLLPRNVFSFESADCPLPEIATLDTSFVVNALMSGEKHHVAAVEPLSAYED